MRGVPSVCGVGPSTPQTLPIATDLTWYPADGTFTLLLDGYVAPGSRIAKVTLESATQTRQLALVKGYFLTNLAVAAQGQLPTSGGPYILAGYDGHDHEVSRVDLARLAGSAGP